MKRLTAFSLALLLILPSIANAQGTIGDLIGEVQSLVGMLVPLLIGVALVGVLWGLARYAFRAGDEKAQEEGRRIMLWGVITIFVMVSIWGFVGILQTMFGVGGITQPSQIPTLNEYPAGGGGGGVDESCAQDSNC